MPQRRQDGRSTPPRLGGEGTAYVYIAPCRGEALLKLGFSRDPLARLEALHRRYYDFFEHETGWLIQTDRVREARDLELWLRADLGLHLAPSPLLVAPEAGGHTEWFRGAQAALSAATDRLQAAGHLVHRPLTDWLQARLVSRSDRLYEWAEQMLQAIEQAGFTRRSVDADVLQRQLRDTLDAYPAFGIDLAPHVSASVRQWYGEVPSGW